MSYIARFVGDHRLRAAQGTRATDERRRGVVDEVDREIIRVLQRNGRTSNTDIARVLKVTETTVRKRIARLMDEELVNVVAVPTPRAVGMTMSAIIGISVLLPSLQAVSEQLVTCPEVPLHRRGHRALRHHRGGLLQRGGSPAGVCLHQARRSGGRHRGRDQSDPEGSQVLLRLGDSATDPRNGGGSGWISRGDGSSSFSA
jgi:DNA-binding transcriptional ArsR family regulator